MGRPAQKKAPTFGARLSNHRRRCGLSQEKFAELLDMTVKGVDYYERRAVNPNAEFVKKAAHVLGTTPDELLDFKEGKKVKPGPPPRMLTLVEDVLKLPKAKQKMAIQFLETLVKTG